MTSRNASGVPELGPLEFTRPMIGAWPMTGLRSSSTISGTIDVIDQELRAAGIEDRIQFYVHVRIGKPADELLDLAHDIGADLVIIGSKGLTGIERIVLGSVSEKVVREARCTVEVARLKTYDHVELSHIVEVAPHRTYVPPHRYTYDDPRLETRPPEWPLY